MPVRLMEAPVGVPVGQIRENAPKAEPSLVMAPRVTVGRILTALLVGGPVMGLALFMVLGWGRVIGFGDLILAISLYLFTGFGVTAGFHRLFAHHSFKANRPLKVLLAVAGSLSLQGSIISWVAIHRRHHVFSDKMGDPHSPERQGSGIIGTLRGFVWGHVGWLFASHSAEPQRFASELVRDPDLVVVDKLFPVLAVGSLLFPFAVGWLAYGTLTAAFAAFVLAGLVRVALLHHVTWSINSVCHLWGRRPFTTTDHSTNVSAMALVSLGESWHNFHHNVPASARHGALPHQMDPTARLIRFFESAGWVTKVRWPTLAQLGTADFPPSKT